MASDPVRIIAGGDLNGPSDPVRIANWSEFIEATADAVAAGYHQRGVFAYLTAPAATTVVTAGTYYPINGPFTNNPIKAFTIVADPAIQYTNSTTMHFEIDIHASISGDANGITASVALRRNSVLVPSSVMGTFLKISNELQAISCTCVVELAVGDKIQLVVSADHDGDVITFANFTTTIRPFF